MGHLGWWGWWHMLQGASGLCAVTSTWGNLAGLERDFAWQWPQKALTSVSLGLRGLLSADLGFSAWARSAPWQLSQLMPLWLDLALSEACCAWHFLQAGSPA